LRVIEPEGERYAADLLFLHGLWSRPAVWGRVAVGLAQRGWRCWLLDARVPAPAEGGGDAAVDLASWQRRAEAAIAHLDAPPIVIGHDAGGLIALALARAAVPRAAIAVAPLLAGTRPYIGFVQRELARWLGTRVAPPPRSHACFRALSAQAQTLLAAALDTEEGRLVASVRGAALLPGAPRVPALVVAQEADPVVPASLAEITARGIEADVLVLPGGHWPMAEERIDVWTTHLHRWIIRRAGKDLLLLRGDEDLRDD